MSCFLRLCGLVLVAKCRNLRVLSCEIGSRSSIGSGRDLECGPLLCWPLPDSVDCGWWVGSRSSWISGRDLVGSRSVERSGRDFVGLPSARDLWSAQCHAFVIRSGRDLG
ncbi:hypothetical protein L2E82_05629 [Cichorium intybus]|uniref:Uncharacterized protein n=1 Tax=Cichorium intybus TaxID=13427 RepID=A0ACB9H8C4_CICIN|nr:hypothetical protein L2E82_05629 [Cichorium intybus]